MQGLCRLLSWPETALAADSAHLACRSFTKPPVTLCGREDEQCLCLLRDKEAATRKGGMGLHRGHTGFRFRSGAA